MKTRRCNVNDDALRLVHVPDVHVSVFILSANLGIPTTIIHDLQFPACREVPRDDFYAFLQMQPLSSLEPVCVVKPSDIPNVRIACT
jgi:hypothetical protein